MDSSVTSLAGDQRTNSSLHVATEHRPQCKAYRLMIHVCSAVCDPFVTHVPLTRFDLYKVIIREVCWIKYFTINIRHVIWITLKECECAARSIPSEIGVGVLTPQIIAVTLYYFG